MTEDERQWFSDRILEKQLTIGNLEGSISNRNRELATERARSAKLLAAARLIIIEFKNFRPQNYPYFEAALIQLESSIAEYEASRD